MWVEVVNNIKTFNSNSDIYKTNTLYIYSTYIECIYSNHCPQADKLHQE